MDVEFYMMYTLGTPAIFKTYNIIITNQTPEHASDFGYVLTIFSLHAPVRIASPLNTEGE